MEPKVSIIIPCRNEERYIVKNITSILAQDYLGELEVIVVDGMSTDKTRELVLDFDDLRVKLVDNEAQFTPHALNLGVKNATGEIFIILGGHAFLTEWFVRSNVKILKQDSTVGCAGGQILNIHENAASELISKAMTSPFGVGNATFRTGGKAGFVDTVAFGAYWKRIHDEIGGFDEDLVRNQDDEYNYKVVKAGYKIYFDPYIVSNYYVRGSYSKLYRQYYQYGYWKVYVNKKHKTITTIRQMIPLFFVLGLIGGLLLSFIWTFFWLVFLSGIGAYLLLAIASGIRVGKSVLEGLRIALVFPLLHFSYGLGYLVGIVEFFVLNKKPSNRSKSSTRS